MGAKFFHVMPNVDYLVISRRVGSSLEVGRPKGCEAAAACPRAKRGNVFGYIPSRKRSRWFSALPPQRLMKTLLHDIHHSSYCIAQPCSPATLIHGCSAERAT